MLDFALLLVAGLCQLALGLLGLRVSVHPPKKTMRGRYEFAFLLIGVIGLLAIVWSGIRSVNVQGAIAQGVEKIETKLGIINSERTSDGEWPLTSDEKNRLGAALEAIDTSDRFPVTIICNDNAALYAIRLARAFNENGWTAKPACSFLVQSTATGIGFAFSSAEMTGKKEIPAHAKRLMAIFDAAHIDYSKNEWSDLKDDEYGLHPALLTPA